MVSANSRVAVYTAITGGRDGLKEQQCFEGADFIAFTDFASSASGWQVREACRAFAEPRLNSRIHKHLPHLYLPGYAYSLWIDGSIRLLTPVWQLIDRYLGDSDLAVFRHSQRDCLYDEAEYCKAGGHDEPAVIDAQVRRYRAEGYPEHNGLIEGGVLLRRHTPSIRQLSETWWSELCHGSLRDQISANYVFQRLGLTPAYFPDTVYTSQHFAFEGHAG